MTFEMLPPATQIKLLRRGLHILSLLQNDEEKWNASKLTDCLKDDPQEIVDVLEDKQIKDAINTIIKKGFDIEIDSSKGKRNISLTEDIDNPEIIDILSMYANFVVHDSSRRAVYESLYRNNPHRCLWILAKLYFASKTGHVVNFRYVTNHQKQITTDVKPYHIVYRNNNLYLVGKCVDDGILKLFILNRISDLKETSISFDIDEIPDPESIFENSLGSFVSDITYDITVRFKSSLKKTLLDIFSGLDPEFSGEGDMISMSFTACDIEAVCKQLFLFGDKVEIVSPREVREKMLSMLKESLSLYS